MKRKEIAAMIAAAGSGKRMKSPIPKPFIKIAGKPLVEYSVGLFEKSNLIDEIVLVVEKGLLNKTKKFFTKKNYKKLKKIVAGGPTRAHSVYNGLCAISKGCDIVAIHDAARPLLTQKLLAKCLKATLGGTNCIAAVPAKATIKKINLKNKYILTTPDRKTLYEAQTPQVVKRKDVLNAYSKLKDKIGNFKDDASLLEAIGVKVKIIEGDYSNIKITTKEDIKIAEALFKNNQ